MPGSSGTNLTFRYGFFDFALSFAMLESQVVAYR
jgi:hypothetical protein